jgi:hypothetical protein
MLVHHFLAIMMVFAQVMELVFVKMDSMARIVWVILNFSKSKTTLIYAIYFIY